MVWLYSTLSSLPDLVLLGVLVFMFTGSIFDDVTRPYLSLVPIYVAMCLTFWIGPCRVIRGEVLKIKELEYVQAATAIGFGRGYILLRHALPNTLHLMFINFSLLFVAAIKNEVVLSFLGLGVKAGTSWGLMIHESIQQVINGFYWQIGAATVFMFGLVLAFNVVSDALQDAFDPKHVG
ncbi:ABC transporter permease [Leptolyngbya sp. 15MV]|nr:ABC transporter permease [Leptolyngbya sp. 15MV]